MAISPVHETSRPIVRALPPFLPHPWLGNGHVQTLLGAYWPSRHGELAADPHVIPLPDGDRLSVLESIPDRWRPGDPVALLVHGLCGSARSNYVERLGRRLVALGFGVVRMNLRGAGPGAALARRTYHSGRTEDLRAVAHWIAGRATGSAIGLVGFSLGGNLVLKLAAEAVDDPVAGLDCVLAACPPIDLSASCRYLRRPAARAYQANFVKLLREQVRRQIALYPDLEPADLTTVRTVDQFDEVYTAPRNGFADAEDYYARSSAGPLLGRIAVPGLVLAAEDDPFIPPDSFRRATFPPGLSLELVANGGHLGFLSHRPWGEDRRWLDSRLASWLVDRWGERSPHTGDLEVLRT